MYEFDPCSSNSNNLCHTGVKGMKWGVRKDRKSGSSSRSRQRQQRKQARQKQRQKNKNIRKQIREVKRSRRRASKRRMLLSESELTSRIDRLAKEKKLKELTDEQVSPGRTFVKNQLTKSGGKSIDAVSSFGIEIGKHTARKALGMPTKKKK